MSKYFYESDSLLSCMREIKKLIVEEHKEEVILLCNEYANLFFIFDDRVHVSHKLNEIYKRTQWWSSPDFYAYDFQIVLYTKDHEYPNYVDIKKSLFKNDIYRLKAHIEPEYSVDFNIMISRKENK